MEPGATAGFKLARTYPCGQRVVPQSGQNNLVANCNIEKPITNNCSDVEVPLKGSIRRKVGLSDGVYVRGVLEGIEILFTADTGASKTVLASRLYNKLDVINRPKLVKSNCLKGAGGAPLNEVGKGVFRMKIGSLKLNTEMVVADIEDDSLLGVDVLQNNKDLRVCRKHAKSISCK